MAHYTYECNSFFFCIGVNSFAMAKRNILLQSITAGMLVVICVFFFWYIVPESLFLKEQVPQFSNTINNFLSYLDKPAWLVCYVGNLFTHLFIPLGGGPILIAMAIMLEWWLLVLILKRFNIGEMAFLYALFPIMLEWGCYCNEKYLLLSIFSFTLSLAIFLLYTYINNSKWSIFWGLMFLPLIYFLAGNRLTIYLVMILLYEANKDEKRWLFWLILLVIGGVFPNLMRYVYGISQEQAYLYPNTNVMSFFPAMLFCASLFVLQTKTLRRVQVSVCSVSVTTMALLAVLGISVSLCASF